MPALPKPCCAIVDLRQYTLRPGQRDTLIEIFDAHFLEGQEAHGMHIAGQFRDLDDPDRFVWIRGYPDLSTRAAAQHDFYTGPVWKAHGKAAGATMVDSSNALMLRPVCLRDGYPALGDDRPPDGATQTPDSVVAGAVYHRRSGDDGLATFFRDEVEPILADSGALPVACLETLAEPNGFPQLPVRDETVLAWLAVFPDDRAYDVHRRTLTASPAWERKVLPELERRSVAPAQYLRLRPTARSQLR